MTDYTIPCETFARLTTVLNKDGEELDRWFRSVRIDHGVAVCTNRRMLAIENIGAPAGVIHVVADPVLIAQCRTETPFASVLTITVNEPLQYAVAKTTLGYTYPGNCCVWPDGSVNEFDRWRSVVERCREPASDPKGVMFWNAANVANLASASPSGGIVFERVIDATRPVLVRDAVDPNWLGVFNPHDPVNAYHAAVFPEWLA